MKIGSGTWNVSVYSIAGNLIYTRNIINTQDIQLELHDFAEGMYCLKSTMNPPQLGLPTRLSSWHNNLDAKWTLTSRKIWIIFFSTQDSLFL